MFFLSLLVSLCLSAAVSRAQVDVITTVPYDGQTDVSTSACVRVRAPSQITPSSVSGRFPKAARGANGNEPTVLVVRKSVQDAMDRKDWSRRSIVGKATLVDEQTLEWRPRRLMPNTTYHCVVQGLTLQSATGTTAVPTLEFDFTTSADVARVAATTMDSTSIISCTTPIWIRMSASPGDEVSVRDLLRVEQPSSTGSWEVSDQPLIQRVSEDLVAIVPRQGWQTNLPVRVHVKMSRLTGDVTDDRDLEAMVRGASTVVVRAHSLTGRALPESIVGAAERNSAVVTEQGRLVASMPAYAEDRWRFVRWESEHLPEIHNSAVPAIDVSISCKQMQQQFDIRAIYEFVDTVELSVKIDSLGTVDVTDQDGRLLAVVEDSANVLVGEDVTRVHLLARTVTGATFSSWTGNIVGVSGSTAPSVSVPIATLVVSAVPPASPVKPSSGSNQAANHYNTHLNPKFLKPVGVVSERYRLRARLMNAQPEELHPIEQHIQFTTPQEFEESKQDVRSVCVVADECWEITGYHDAATGPPVWFTKGRRELCVESELLDPENTLVIFGRRIPIDVRIERVVLNSENDNDVILDQQPHNETRILIDKQIFINGIERWLPVDPTNCVVDRIAQQRVGVRCGDKIRITVRAAEQRGEEWRWWSLRSKYILPREAESNNGTRVFTMTVAENLAHFDATDCDGVPLGYREIAVRAAFRQRFVIDSIALRVRVKTRGERAEAFFEERWMDPLKYYDRAPDEPRDCRQLEYIARRGTTIKLRFSRPVDVLSIYAGGIKAETVASILHTDPQAKDLDFTTASNDRGNTMLFSSTGQFLDIVQFSVYEPDTKPLKQALHMGIIDLLCSTSIRSASNEPLLTQQQFILNRMEIPGYAMLITDAVFEFDGDTDFLFFANYGELYHALYGMNVAKTGPANMADGFIRYPDCRQQQAAPGDCTVDYDDGDDDHPFSFGNREIWAQTQWMDAGDVAFTRLASWDEDCKNNDRCLVNRIQGVLDELKNRADDYKKDKGDSVSKTLPFDLIALGASLIGALLPISEQDDHLGEVTFLEGMETLWGMSRPTAPRILLSVENAEYRLRGKWFTARTVVR